MNRRLMQRLTRYFHSTGLMIGTAFFAMSLTPSLLPRSELVQGVISGLSMAAGYGVGVLCNAFWAYFHLPVPRLRTQYLLQLGAWAFSLLLALIFLWQAAGWQDRLRSLMGLEPTSGIQLVSLAVIALLVFLSVLLLVRLFRRTFHFVSRYLGRYVPQRVSLIGGLLAAFILFWLVADGVLFSLTLRTIDRTYQEFDALMDPESAEPRSGLMAGSESSLLNWNELGRLGRRYLNSGPTRDDIAAFSGADAMQPLRVYVGLNSAETAEERAALALAELQRLNAFERELLILITPTGTGWVDPGSIDTVEYLFRGDVASVAAQYSYLPSPVSLLAEGEYAVDMARSLFQTVYGHWRTLPRDNRPRLFLLGLSLGALNSDLSFDFYDIIEDPFDGVLWSGPPFRSETWRNITARRDGDSPQRLPHFRDGSVVRFANQQGGLDLPGDWGSFRIAFLQYASDPITFFDPDAWYREPDWMKEPRAFDVSPDLRWFPIVTMLQLAADLATGTSPEGYGHDYAPEHYHDAWVALLEPQGWTAAQLASLRALHQAAEE